MVDMFAKAGVDLTATLPNLAQGATATASYTASRHSTGAAPSTASRSTSRSGGPTAPKQDWYELNFGAARTVDEVRLYFRNDRARGGPTEPALYRIQYERGGLGGRARPGPDAGLPALELQPRPLRRGPDAAPARADAAPRRLQDRPQGGPGLPHRRGRGGDGNAAPYVVAKQDLSFRRPAAARLEAVVEDDALPAGTLESSWRLVDGPGVALFDGDIVASPRAARTRSS